MCEAVRKNATLGRLWYKKILMRRSKLTLKKLYALTKYMLGKINLTQQVKKRKT